MEKVIGPHTIHLPHASFLSVLNRVERCGADDGITADTNIAANAHAAGSVIIVAKAFIAAVAASCDAFLIKFTSSVVASDTEDPHT